MHRQQRILSEAHATVVSPRFRATSKQLNLIIEQALASVHACIFRTRSMWPVRSSAIVDILEHNLLHPNSRAVGPV
jgi:hypothetical protein